ncbi:MAG TPA: metal-sulfur cluster assembly factor [Opitutaceae bacterium]|nr:metal-sulfur cluster assembly factor [Opitutaceae bacterium]
MALTKEDVVSVLRTCRDPELPVNIVDLGLSCGVDVREAAAAAPGSDVSVKMTLTSPACPMARAISAGVHRKILGLDRVRHAKTDLVWEPAWHPAMITPEGRRHLNPT